MDYMDIAINLAKKANDIEEIPVGAVIVRDDVIISKGYNKRHLTNNVLAHAEVIAILSAQKKLKSWHLNDCVMYVTLKPCSLCERVIKEARIDRVYYLLDKQINKKEYNKTKFEEYAYDTEVYSGLLAKFFQNKR